MTRDYIDFQDRSQPVGFLITIRCYGTWLHGDERGSMDGSTRYLWTAEHVATAVDYVVNGQGGDLPQFD